MASFWHPDRLPVRFGVEGSAVGLAPDEVVVFPHVPGGAPVAVLVGLVCGMGEYADAGGVG